MFTDLISRNFKKFRVVARKLSSVFTKKQLMIISIILLVIFCFFGWFQFSRFLKDVIYYVLFTILAGQAVMYFYIHAVKHARDEETDDEDAPVVRTPERDASPEEVEEVHREYRRRRHPDA